MYYFYDSHISQLFSSVEKNTKDKLNLFSNNLNFHLSDNHISTKVSIYHFKIFKINIQVLGKKLMFKNTITPIFFCFFQCVRCELEAKVARKAKKKKKRKVMGERQVAKRAMQTKKRMLDERMRCGFVPIKNSTGKKGSF